MFETILIGVFTGFLAQLIDGALGMAYGVSSTTALVIIGVCPALASSRPRLPQDHIIGLQFCRQQTPRTAAD